MGWKHAFAEQFPKAKANEPMKDHTTFRIGGAADCFLEASTFTDVKTAADFANQHNVPFFILGWGSNLLVRDGGIRGIVLKMAGEFEKIEFPESEPLVVRAGAAVRLPALVIACAEHGLAGAESLVGVPGTLGGGLVMNAGTREGEIGTLVTRVRVYDISAGSERWLTGDELKFTYRRSNLENQVILGAELQLKRGIKVDILRRVREFQEKRQKTQPIHTYNVGSTFKNPPGRFVAQLIEECGLKGFQKGGARVSEKHANFFENSGSATAKDMLDLVEAVSARVRERFGIDLELEMKVVGEA